MMEDVKAGRTDYIVVKDLSRFGRNYLDAGEYIEKAFPFLGAPGFGETKSAPALSGEARRLAARFERLDARGKGSVLAAVAYEESFASPGSGFEKTAERGDSVEVTVYDQPAAAGLGNYLSEPDSHAERFPQESVPEGTDFGILISGDSMEPRIRDGSVVFVRAAPYVEPGEIGVFILNGDAYCKKLVVDAERGAVLLRSLNPKYGDIAVGESDDLRTVGAVLCQ